VGKDEYGVNTVNGKMIPIKTSSEMGEGGDKGKW
jgi:hypothetical protein